MRMLSLAGRILRCLAVSAAALLLLTGCEDKQFGKEEEKAQIDAARAVAETWIESSAPDVKITSLEVLTVRPKHTSMDTYLTDYVKGSCSSGKERFDIAVNTVTGDLYTTREADTFGEILTDQILKDLNIVPSARKIRLHTARRMPVSESTPEFGEYNFQEMLPAVIPDLSTFAAEAFTGEDMEIYLEIAYNGEPPEAPAESAAFRDLLHPAGRSVISLYRLEDGAVPDEAVTAFDMSYAPVFASEVLKLKGNEIIHARYALDESAAPYLLHFPEEIIRITETEDGMPERSVQSFRAGADGDCRAELAGGQRVLVHTAGKDIGDDLYVHLLLQDYSAVDSIPEVLLKERSKREWYHDLLNWELVEGRYVLSGYSTPERVQDQDVFVSGETGRALLKKQTEDNEKRLKEEKKK